MIDWDKPVEWVANNGGVTPVTFAAIHDGEHGVEVKSKYGSLYAYTDGRLAADCGYIRNTPEPEAIVGELASFDGPTLRDQLAMAALTGFLSFGAARLHPCERMAKDAYQVADAMMEARNA